MANESKAPTAPVGHERSVGAKAEFAPKQTLAGTTGAMHTRAGASGPAATAQNASWNEPEAYH